MKVNSKLRIVSATLHNTPELLARGDATDRVPHYAGIASSQRSAQEPLYGYRFLCLHWTPRHLAPESTILPFFRTSLTIDNKSDGRTSIRSTEADRAAEAVMRAADQGRASSQHGIVGEEFGNERTDAEYVWVLDPIDGTKSFIAGFPVWGTLIALTHRGVPVYRHDEPAVHRRAVLRRQQASASYRGPVRRAQARRAALRGACRTRCCSPPARVLMNDADRATFGRVESEARLTRYGGDCYCLLPCWPPGRSISVIETELKPYDVAALILIITGAGGIITTWEGGPAHQRRPHHRRQRSAGARSGAETAE
ncbi:MAG: hypothetical protein MZV49_04250 [Rhodopseudomonas palustris]|nr:hypothetical protein [Rhodopseudomonas palustris]